MWMTARIGNRPGRAPHQFHEPVGQPAAARDVRPRQVSSSPLSPASSRQEVTMPTTSYLNAETARAALEPVDRKGTQQIIPIAGPGDQLLNARYFRNVAVGEHEARRRVVVDKRRRDRTAEQVLDLPGASKFVVVVPFEIELRDDVEFLEHVADDVDPRRNLCGGGRVSRKSPWRKPHRARPRGSGAGERGCLRDSLRSLARVEVAEMDGGGARPKLKAHFRVAGAEALRRPVRSPGLRRLSPGHPINFPAFLGLPRGQAQPWPPNQLPGGPGGGAEALRRPVSALAVEQFPVQVSQ